MSAASNAVFLSYASQDAEATRRICEVLRAAGIEVWFDQEALVGGDAWDAKIRGQIGSCALFVPVISANTQARREGYFRLEWKLAAQRTHMISERTAFLLPVVIDATRDAEADVPTEFRAVQWTKLPVGETSLAFVSRVQTLLGGPGAPIATAAPGTPPPGASTPVAKSGRPPWITAALGALVLGVIAFIALRPTAKQTPAAKSIAETKPAPAAAAAPATLAAVALPKADDKSVAVLAFANMSADKDTEYFSDGVSEEILNALANNPGLRVAARTSSFSFKGKNATAGEIGRALNVARVIEGSVRKAGGKVRITVQLINAADGYHMWSEAFDREMTDIFAVQSEIAAKVAQKLAGGSASAATVTVPSVTAPTKNLAAYDLYLQGRALQTGPETRETMLETIRLYDEAVQLDPGYALAWARLSQATLRMRGLGRTDDGDTRRSKTRSAADTALRLAPDLPEAHLAMAIALLSVDRDHEAALRELNEAERLRPNDPEILAARAQLEFARGKWSAALTALVMRSVELDPQNVGLLNTGNRILTDIGRFAEADQLCNRHVSLAPALTRPVNRKAENYLAWTGDLRGTLAIIETVPDDGGGMIFILELSAAVRAALGDFAPAIADYERMRGSSRGGRGLFVTYRMARLEARQGHAARASELLAESLESARQRASEFPDLAGPSENLALVHAARREKSEALAAIAEAMRIVTRDRDASEIARTRRVKAEVLTVLGQKDAAIAELRAVHQMGYAFGYLLRVGLEWEPLRGEAKFQELMKDAEARANAQPRPRAGRAQF